MDWQLFTMLQTVLVATGVVVAFVLHNRKLTRQNEALRSHLDQSGAPDPQAWVKEYLETLESDAAATPVISALFNNALQPDPDFITAKLPELLQSSGLSGDGGGEGGGEELEAALAKISELEAQLEKAPEPAESSDKREEMKTLLMQLTQDSREMLACISQLESENADLLEKLKAAGVEYTAPARESVKAESTDEAAAPSTLDDAAPPTLDEAVTENSAEEDSVEEDSAEKAPAEENPAEETSDAVQESETPNSETPESEANEAETQAQNSDPAEDTDDSDAERSDAVEDTQDSAPAEKTDEDSAEEPVQDPAENADTDEKDLTSAA